MSLSWKFGTECLYFNSLDNVYIYILEIFTSFNYWRADADADAVAVAVADADADADVDVDVDADADDDVDDAEVKCLERWDEVTNSIIGESTNTPSYIMIIMIIIFS